MVLENPVIYSCKLNKGKFPERMGVFASRFFLNWGVIYI